MTPRPPVGTPAADAVNGAEVTAAPAGPDPFGPRIGIGVGAELRMDNCGCGPLPDAESYDGGVADPCFRTLTPAAYASASASSCAVWNLRAGSRSSARANHASKLDGSPGTTCDGTGGGEVQIFTSRSPTLTPSNGSTPATHLNAMIPSDQRSVR